MIGVRATPDAGGLVEQVAFFGVGAAPGGDARRVGQEINRVHDFGFEGYFMTDMVTVADFGHFPFFLSHTYLQRLLLF